MEACGIFGDAKNAYTYCAWATKSSFGFVSPDKPVQNPSYGELKVLMRKMRADLEKKT